MWDGGKEVGRRDRLQKEEIDVGGKGGVGETG